MGEPRRLTPPEQCLKRGSKEEFTIVSEIGEFVTESIFDYGDKRAEKVRSCFVHFKEKVRLFLGLLNENYFWLVTEARILIKETKLLFCSIDLQCG